MRPTPAPDDAALAVAAAAGDTNALGLIFDRYGSRLLGFCITMLRSRADAEDCTQDVFIIAATRLRDLREPALLRSWLFSVARHECLARLDKSKKEVLMDDVPERPYVEADVATSVDPDLAALFRDAAAGLSDRERLLLELADRQQLSGDELANAIGVARSTAYTLVARARTNAKKAIGALLVARTGRGQCPTLDLLLTDWDGQLTSLRRKQLARHIENCEVCDEHRSRVATPAALFGEGRAFAAELVALRSRILAAAGVHIASGGRAGAGEWRNGWPPADRVFGGSQRRRRKVALIALLVVLIGAGAAGAGVAIDRSRQPQPAAVVTPLSSAPSTPPATVSLSTSPKPTPTAPTTTNPPGAPPSVVTVTKTVVVPPPPPSSAASSPPATIWTVLVYTFARTSATVTINGNSTTCLYTHTQTPCTYSVANGTAITVTANNDAATFSSPPSCNGTGPTCTTTVTENTKFQLAG